MFSCLANSLLRYRTPLFLDQNLENLDLRWKAQFLLKWLLDRDPDDQDLQRHAARISLSRLTHRSEGAIPKPLYSLDSADAQTHPHGLVTLLHHRLYRPVVKGPLKLHFVRDELVVQPWRREGLAHVHPVLEQTPGRLGRGADDAAPARGAGDEEDGPVGVLGNDRGDGTHGPFARPDVVCRGRREAEAVADAGDAEVVHLVVEDDARIRGHDLRAEEQVDGRRRGDGHAGAVGRHDVRSAVAFGWVLRVLDVLLYREGGTVVDLVVGSLGPIQAKEGLFELFDIGDILRVSQLQASAIGKPHGFDESMGRQVRVRQVIFWVLFHSLEHVEHHGSAAGRAGGVQFEAAKVDAGRWFWNNVIGSHVIHCDCAVGFLYDLDNRFR